MGHLFREDPLWRDVIPVPQDDGPNPVVPIAYSEEFEDAMDYFRAVVAAEEKTERVLALTKKVVELNSANYTAWHYRRKVLEELEPDLQEELSYLDDMMAENTKNYQVWYHRMWVAERIGSLISKNELKFTAEILEIDSKNYHAWSYRQWVLRTLGGWEGELEFCEMHLTDDVWNNSAWNQRLYVLKSQPGARPLEESREEEINFCKSAILRAPSNESPWRYLEGLYSNDWKKMVEEGKLMVLSMEVLKVDRKSVHAHRLAMELLFRGASLEELDLNLVKLDAEIVSEATTPLEVAAAICDSLCLLDPMRKHYWTYRRSLIKS